MKLRSVGTLGLFLGLLPSMACSAPAIEESAVLDETATPSTSASTAPAGAAAPSSSSGDGGVGDATTCEVDGGSACTFDCQVPDCELTCAPVAPSSCALNCDANGCSFTCPSMCGCVAELKPTCTKTCNDCHTICQVPSCTMQCVEVCDANGCAPVCDPVCAPPSCATVCGSKTCGQKEEVLETPPQCEIHCPDTTECTYVDSEATVDKTVLCRDGSASPKDAFVPNFHPACEVTCAPAPNVAADVTAYCATSCAPPDCTVTCDPPSPNDPTLTPANCVTTCAPSKCHAEKCHQ